MGVTNFVPEVWTARLLVHLSNILVYAQSGIVNRDYEGDIANAGDTVHITQFGDPTISTYTPNGTLTYETLSDDDRALLIDQAKSFSFKVDDIEKRQALDGFVGQVTQRGSYRLGAVTDTFMSAKMAADCDAGNKLGAYSLLDPTDAYDALVDLRTALTESNCPDAGRWAVVPPSFYALLLKDNRFINAEKAGTDAGLRNGNVGRAAGFDVMESNASPSGNTVIAGHEIATTYAEQITEVEAIRLIDSFGDGIRGLHLYGAKVVQPTALTTLTFDET